jgi:hypothetical protein
MEEMAYTCLCCKKRFKGYGNDPWPLARESYSPEDGLRACDECNELYVRRGRRMLASQGIFDRSTVTEAQMRELYHTIMDDKD